MKKVLFNVTFIDRYTGEERVAGTTAEMTEERVAEIKEVNPNFLSVIGNAEKKADKKADEKKADKKADEK